MIAFMKNKIHSDNILAEYRVYYADRKPYLKSIIHQIESPVKVNLKGDFFMETIQLADKLETISARFNALFLARAFFLRSLDVDTSVVVHIA